MEPFVKENSIVREIWGKSDTVLFIFAGASAEFALNKAVDISLKNIPGTLFCLKLEIRNSDNQLQYLNIFSAKKRSDVVKMIREALK